MRVRITAVHKEDAWYPLRDEVIGLVGETDGRIISTGDEWYNLTMETERGELVCFFHCQFEEVKPNPLFKYRLVLGK